MKVEIEGLGVLQNPTSQPMHRVQRLSQRRAPLRETLRMLHTKGLVEAAGTS